MGQEEDAYPILEGEGAPMLEKDSWSFMPDELFPACKTSGNSKRFPELADKIFCEDGLLEYSEAGADTSLYRYQLDDISPTNGDLNIFVNGHENQECSFMSVDGWPDISYIESMDGLFRSSDSSFAQETVTNEDDMSWFSSSSPTIDGSRDASDPAFRSFSLELGASKSTVRHPEINAYHVPHSAILNSGEKNSQSSCSTLYHPSFGSCSDTNAESILDSLVEKQAVKVDGVIKDKMVPAIKTNNGSSELHDIGSRKLIKNHKQTKANGTDRSSEHSNGVSSLGPDTLQQFVNPRKRSTDTSPNVIALTSEKNSETQQWKNRMLIISSEYQHEEMVNHHPGLDQTEEGVEIHCQAKELSTEQPDLDTNSSVVLESSGLCSMGPGKISVEENSFRKLQHDMEKLNMRTKLCIRDSLYRLAKSAEQRNSFARSMNSSINEDGEMAIEGGTNTLYSRFMDMETDTNPIDRSIAHLLFYKPIEGTSLESNDSASYYAFNHDEGTDFMIQ